MQRFIKRHWLVLLILLVILYLVVGLYAPFAVGKKISSQTVADFDVNSLYSDTLSTDRAMLVETNQSALDERIRLLNQAKERIILSTFDMREGESTRDVLSVILNKAEEGIQVQILVDGVSGAIRMEGNPLFYAIAAHPNVEIRIYNPLNLLMPWKSQGRMHDKYVIVDDLAYILGGRNTFDYFLGMYDVTDSSYDREVLIYNTAAGKPKSSQSSLFEVEDYFHQVWNLEVCKPFHNDTSLLERENVREETKNLHTRYQEIRKSMSPLFEEPQYLKKTVEVNGVHLLSNPIGIYGKEPVLFYQLSQLMQNAKERVIIHTPYTVCNGFMYDTLAGIVKEVPDTTMLINSVENGDNVMASSDYLYNKKKVVDTGIKLYEYDGGNSYHGKSIVIDHNISLIGSYNLDLRSTYVDTELMLMVQSEELTAQLTACMDAFQEDSRKVVDAKNYEVPEHVTVASMPVWRKAMYRVIGFVMQAFRYLV